MVQRVGGHSSAPKEKPAQRTDGGRVQTGGKVERCGSVREVGGTRDFASTGPEAGQCKGIWRPAVDACVENGVARRDGPSYQGAVASFAARPGSRRRQADTRAAADTGPAAHDFGRYDAPRGAPADGGTRHLALQSVRVPDCDGQLTPKPLTQHDTTRPFPASQPAASRDLE